MLVLLPSAASYQRVQIWWCVCIWQGGGRCSCLDHVGWRRWRCVEGEEDGSAAICSRLASSS
jgi:hypothetical protein